jgi:hypothetical protein
MNARTLAFLIGTIAILGGQTAHAASGMASTTCHIKFVSFGFNGTPGTQITYHKTLHVIGASGHLELIAFKNDFTYKVGSATFKLDADTPRDEWGSAAIDLDKVLGQTRTDATVQIADASSGLTSTTLASRF